MENMKIIQIKNCKWIILLLILIFFSTLTNANILFGPSIDKSQITENEVAYLEITIYNDNNFVVEDYLRLQSSDNISFLDQEEKIIAKSFGPINPYEKEVIKVRIKANSLKENEGNIYGYYGMDNDGTASYAFVARVVVKQVPIFIKSSSTLKNTSTGETIFVDYKLTNSSQEPIYGIAFETRAPNGFEIKTEPAIYEKIEVGETVEGTFEIYPPLGAIGDQKITLSYGYYDINGPHYFEKDFGITFQQTDSKLLLGIVGIIVLAIAIFLYLGSRKEKETDIKGTGDKE